MLVLIDENLTDEDIQLLADWRNKNNFAYKDQVIATPESIRVWLKEHYFSKPRMIFWIVFKGKKIGTIGLNFGDGCEIDSCMRGVPDGPGQIGLHLRSLMNLSFRLGYILNLRVLKTNIHAIEFYKKHGFIEKETSEIYMHMWWPGE